MASLDFLPNSPTLMNAGRELSAALRMLRPAGGRFDGRHLRRVKQMALIQKKRRGDRLFFLQNQAQNDTVGSTHGISSGPVSFMRVFDRRH